MTTEEQNTSHTNVKKTNKPNWISKIKKWFTNETYKPNEENLKYDENIKQIIEQIRIPNTPFTIVRHEKKWFLTMGKYRLTEPLETRKEAEAEVKDTSWIRLMQIMKIVCQEHDEEKKLNETIERQRKDLNQKEIKFPN